MPIGEITGVLSQQLIHEAVRLVFDVVGQLHAVKANSKGVLFALAASPQLADRLAAFGAAFENDEGDGCAEGGECLSGEALEAILAPAPRQGHAVTTWSPPGSDLPLPASVDLAQHWPGLVRPVADAG